MEISEVPERAIAPSDDVILLDSVYVPRRERPIRAQVRVTLGDSVSIRAFNFDAELGGSILLRQAPDQLPAASGTLVIEEGRYTAFGQDLTVRRGTLRFAGPVDNPGLSIRATRTVQDTIVTGIAISGTLKDPTVRLFSEPPMSQTQVLSYLTTGRPIGGGGGSAGDMLDKVLGMLGLRGGSLLAEEVGEEFGLDQARLETQGDLREASLVVGRYLSPNLYVSYGIGLVDPVTTLRLRYLLSNRLTLQAERGEETAADILIRPSGRQP